MKPSTFLLVPLAAVASAQFQHVPAYQAVPRADNGALAQGGDLLLPRGANPTPTGGGNGRGNEAIATGGSARPAPTAGGGRDPNGNNRGTTRPSSGGDSPQVTPTGTGRGRGTLLPTGPVTTNGAGASAGQCGGALQSGLVAAAGVALGFAWFL